MNGKQKEKKFFLFYPFEGHGHINPALSMGNELRRRGHDTALLCINDIGYPDQTVICLKKIKEEREKKAAGEKMTITLEEHGTALEALTTKEPEEASDADKLMSKRVEEICLATDPVKSLKEIFTAFYDSFADTNSSEWNQMIRSKTRCNNCRSPCCTCNHETFVQPQMAPRLGVPVNGITDEERQLSWKHFSDAHAPIRPLMKSVMEKAELKDDCQYLSPPDSPHLNIYIYPRELDYDLELGSTLENWHRIQSMNRPKKYQQLVSANETAFRGELLSEFDIPEGLRKFIEDSRKLESKILFMSLGTIACMDIRMMKRLVSLLAETPYRIIVSKGSRHNEFDLAPNMWGAKYVPQKEILLLVDLVITHGGNNTITECLYSGVPGIIVCPMFCDQLDNAIRMEEKMLGVTVNLRYSNSDQLLLESIEKVLADDGMQNRIKKVSLEMRQPNEGPEKAVELIENLAC